MHGRFVWFFFKSGVIFPFSVQQHGSANSRHWLHCYSRNLEIDRIISTYYLPARIAEKKCVLVTGCDSGFSHLLAQELDKRGSVCSLDVWPRMGRRHWQRNVPPMRSFCVLTSRKRIRFETLFTWSSRKWQATKAGAGTYCSLDA